MNIGMLWFDNDPKSAMEVKLERAAAFYRNKYGKTPDLCFVHPSMLPGNPPGPTPGPGLRAAGLELRPERTVLPNHFWLGLKTPSQP